MNKTTPPLIVILGPTASGKSALAMYLAEKFNGELICADSRTIYKGMDIGTAKPSGADRAKVKHHLLDVVEPNEKFNVAQFKELANQAINDISSRGKLAIMVGGTGLYIDSVIFDYSFSQEGAERDPINPRHLKRSDTPQPKILRSNTLVLGLSVEQELLKQRIADRVEEMVRNGFIEEVERVSKRFGWDAPGLLAPGYRAFRGYLEGSVALTEAKAQFVLNDSHLAKRQRTWFKRNKYIHWVSTPEETELLVEQFLVD